MAGRGLGVVSQHPKRPRDPNQLAKLAVDLAAGETEESDLDAGKDQATVSLGRRGGLKGGKARARHASAIRDTKANGVVRGITKEVEGIAETVRRARLTSFNKGGSRAA